MTDREQYAACPCSAAQLGQFWSAHVDVLERHLSARTWALAAGMVVLIVYPIARILIPAALHHIVLVPEAVRTVLKLI